MLTNHSATPLDIMLAFFCADGLAKAAIQGSPPLELALFRRYIDTQRRWLNGRQPEGVLTVRDGIPVYVRKDGGIEFRLLVLGVSEGV